TGIQPIAGGFNEAFLVKLNASGSQLIYSARLGGSYDDRALALAVDAGGNAYIAGQTDSPEFPVVGSTRTTNFTTLFKSADAAANWNAAANGLPNSTVRAIAFNPTNSAEILAATNLGLFRTTNGGGQWNAVTLPALSGGTLSVTAVAFDPKTPATIYLGTSAGVYKSFNGGQSFQLRSIGLANRAVARLAIDPVNTATLYAATTAGVFKTTDGGESWLAFNSGLNDLTINALVINPNEPATLYAGTARGVFKTVNGATAWTAASNGLGTASSPLAIGVLAIDPVAPATLYAAVNSATGAVLFKTTDGGANWRAADTGLATTTGGVQTRAVPAALAISTLTPATIYAATPQGLFKSADGGGAWALMNKGITNPNLTAVTVDVTGAVYAGAVACTDAFVAKVNPAGSALVYSMAFGGADCDIARGLAVDAAGAAWVTGDTMSADFPVVAPRQARLNGAGDAFVAKLNPAGAALSFSTFLGGSGPESGYGIALDAAGNAIVVGETSSTNFPAAGGYKTTPGGGSSSDGFIAKYKADGSAIEYASYFGGNSTDQIFAVAVDKGGSAWVAGTYFSGEFPSVNPLPRQEGLFGTLFIARFSADGKQLLFASEINGGSTDTGRAIAVDTTNNVYVAGIANSFSFPLINPIQSSNGTPNAFALKLSPAADAAVTIADSPDPVLAGGQLTYTATVANRGDLPLTAVRLTDALPQGATLVSATASQGACSGAATVTCELGTLTEGASARVTIVVNAPLSGTVSNTVNVTAAETEANTQNNSATTTTQIVTADLSLTVTPSLLRVAPGGRLSWLLTVRNLSSQRVPGVRLSDTLPAETTFVSCSTPLGGSCAGTGNERSAILPSLDANGAATVTITAMVNGNLPPTGSITNTARLEPVAFDPNASNNEARATTMLTAPLPGEAANGLLAFSSSTTGFFGINISRPDGSGRFVFSTGQSPAWSPDGSKLLANIGRPLVMLDADGSGRQFTVTGDADGFSWSPDGTRIAYYSFLDGVFIINADGTGQRNILRQFNNRISMTLKWSPDGTRLLLANDQLDGLYSFNIDGTGVTKLTNANSSTADFQPDWSPDGSRIVFISRRDHFNGELYVINADGSNPVRLTNANNESKKYPVWSPDGKKIAYAGGNDLVIINADGTSPSRFLANVNIGIDWQRAASNQPRMLALSGRLRGGSFDSFSSTMIELTGTRTATALASSDGSYSFGFLPEGGTYTIKPTSAFFRFDPPSRTYANLTTDQTGADFTATRPVTVLRGRITDFAGAPMAGVTVSNGSTRTETDAEGNYVFTTTLAAQVTITPGGGQTTAQFEPAFITLPITEGLLVANFKGIRLPYRISGQVTNNNGAAVADVTVSVAGGGRNATATTDSQGRYEFANLPGGFIYTVSAARSGVTISPAVRRVALGRDLDLRFIVGVGSLTGVSAASYSPHAVTVAGIVALFGQGLSTNTVAATGTTLPVTLDGVSVFVTNRNIGIRQCRLFFVSPGQINAALPPIESTQDDAGIYSGEALVEVRRGSQVLAAGSIEIERAAPALFTADASGTGFPPALALRVGADGSQVFDPVARFDPATGRFVAVPIDVSNPTEQVFLVLFATGLRHRSDPADVALKLGNETAMVTFAGAAPGQTGVDQLNALLPRSLAGSGEVTVLLTTEGKTSNAVKLNFK
ncbi:MAG TPA: SBBP repeat-containing protein, partial [Blastocatellia bacterium]|nr:SBBP repeat-containing protein [Blastocatellia bacterium]